MVLGTTTPPAGATHPGSNGRIAFLRWDAQGTAQIFTANPDLTAQQQITHGSTGSGWPAWSPDGSRITFDSDRSDPDPTDDHLVNDVFTMRADGSDVQKLTDSLGFSGDPAYSPDGSLVVFASDRGVKSNVPEPPAALPGLSIFMIRTDGTGLRRITTPPQGSTDTEPRFSPDGTKVLFTRFQGGHYFDYGRAVGDTSAVFTADVDGTNLKRVTGWGMKAGQADWSPDGSRIVFEVACCRYGAGGIYTVRADGNGFRAIVNGHGRTGNEQALQVDGYYDPVWSPDGTKIIAGREHLQPDGTWRVGLVIVDADGSNLHWVATDVHDEHQPDWGTAPLT
jgi:Tol biopolymer transport system component